MLGALLTDKISNLINTQKIKAAAKEQNDYLQAIFDAYNSGGSSRGIKENIGESSRFTPEIENYLNSLDEAKKKGQEVKASLEDFGDGSQFKRIAEGANETSEALERIGDTGKQAAEGTENIGEAAASAAEGMENVSKSSTSAGTNMSKVASVGKAVLGTLANVAIYYAISEAITLAAEAWDNYANAQENAIERGNTALANMDENNSKVDAMKSALDAVNENTVEVDGQTITRFQQLSEGVNSLGENVSLSSSEFEEYTTILNSLTDAGFTATDSMSALKREMQEMQDSVNYDNLEGLNDWVDSFNAQNNQIASDFTKEVGYQQRIEALEKLQSAADSGKTDAVQEQSWWERILGNLSMSQDMAAAQNAITPWNVDEAEALMDTAQENYEQLIQDATDTAAYKELAERYAIDIFNDSGEIDEEKFLESGNLQRIQDAMKQEMSAREAMVRESAGFLESMFELTPQYKNMSEQVQSTISSLFNNIDYATIEKYMTDSNGQLSSDLMRDWVESLSKNISSDEIQQELENFFDIDTKKSSMNLREYEQAITDSIKHISKEVPQLSDSMLKDLVGFEDSMDELEPAYNRIADFFNSSELADQIHTEDLEFAANLIAEDNFSGTFDEFLDQIKLTKKATSEDINASPLMEAIDTAAESVNRSDDYFKAVENLTKAKELYDDNLTNTDDFKTIAAYLSPTQSSDESNFLENIGRAERYLTEDAAGMQNFVADLENAGLAALDSATQQWTFNIDDYEDAANRMGISTEFMLDMFGRLNDAGLENTFFSSQEDAANHLTELYTELANEQQRYAELTAAPSDGDHGYETSEGLTVGNQTAIDAAKANMEQYRQQIEATKESMKQLTQAQTEDLAEQTQIAIDQIGVLADERERILSDTSLTDTMRQSLAENYEAQIQQIANENYIEIGTDFRVLESPQEAVDELTAGNPVMIHADFRANADSIRTIAEEANRTLQNNGITKINFDFSADINSLDNQISQITSLIQNEFTGTDGLIDFNLDGAMEAVQVLQGLISQKQQLSQPVVMSVNTSTLEGDLATVVGTLQEYQSAVDELDNLQQMQSVGVQVDTSQAEQNVANLKGQLESLTQSTGTAQIMAELNIDPASSASISSQISAITPEMLVKAGVDKSQVDGYKPEDKDATVKYDVDSSLVDAYDPRDKNATVKYSPDTSNLPTSFSTITRKVNYVAIGDTGLGRVNGSAHANGTARDMWSHYLDSTGRSAYASGIWGLQSSETALVNELGQELLVRDGQWTLLPGGAHFQQFKKGDIIFNHKQTEELFKNGMVTSNGGRGHVAHADGTAHNLAFAAGVGFGGGSASLIGNRNTFGTNDKDKESRKAAKDTQEAAKAVQKAASDTTSTVSDEADKFEETLDWIQNYLDRAARNLDVLTDAADKLDGYISQNRYLNEAQSKVKESIAANTNAYNKYMQEAYAVGLSPTYQQKIMSGTLDIETITDENLSNQIKEFQDLYDKALDCADAISDLNAEYVELANQRLSNIQQDFEGLVDVTDAIYDNFSAGNDIREAMGQAGDINNLKEMIGQRNNAANWLRGEFEKMNQELTYMMNQGSIKKYSEDWYAWQAELHNISAALKENQADVIELRQQIREVRWQAFEDAVGKIDAANDELDHTLSLIDDLNSFVSDSGVLNATGLTKMGLLGKQLGNARQLVAEYSHAISLLNTELYSGNISQEQYNEELQEYKSAQQDAISSVKEYRDAIVDLIKDGINAETDAMQKLVDKRKEDLQAQKDAADYAKSLRDQTSTINKIQAQITALEGDDSAAAQAQLRNLQNQLREEQMNLQDMQDDHRHEELINGFDAAMEQFEEIQNAEIENLETSLDAQNQAIQTMLGVAKEQYQTVYDELNHIAEVYGFKLSSDLSDPWKNAQNAAQAYKEAVDKVIADISVNVSKLPSLSTGTADVTYAENVDPSRPTPTPQAPAAQSPAAPSTAGMVSGIGQMLRVGSRGDSVKALQSALNQMGYNAGNVDGIFGNNTKNAVVRFQRDNGISADGIVGPNTKQKFAIHGYARGTKKANSGLAYTDENGSELIATKYGVIRQLDYGDMVFSNEQLQMLWDFSKSRIADTLPKVNTSTPVVNLDAIGMQVDTFLRIENVEGNVDQSILPTINNMIQESIAKNNTNIRKQIKKDARKTGLI